MNLADAGMKLIASAGHPGATESLPRPEPAQQPQIPGFTWETLPTTALFKLQGAKDLPAVTENGTKVELQPNMRVEGTWVGETDGRNVRKQSDGSWNATPLVTVLDAKITSASYVSAERTDEDRRREAEQAVHRLLHTVGPEILKSVLDAKITVAEQVTE
jgi:hypothetical protein